ncbi:dephospho-CoA kinase [Marininema halotolerans]|uniref:Dephospho-CoA kinase n=1 Tax=Marininema halotolerans TaxID=1155944 RepID=A0A1I6S4K6_9BACL|nr:dephospho-CoA kinase [Marininema halotolerans]SFS71876.1 dephospho-CoA kinase [Marininema halotolerans]
MSIGLTGGIATGKSTVAKMIASRGGHIIDADQVAREVVEPGTEGSRRVRERFGNHLFTSSGELDRLALRKVIFHDERARKDLNQLLHPLILHRMKSMRDKIESKPGRMAVLDIPLLIEEGLASLVDQVIVVVVPESLQLQRLVAREGISEEQALKMIQAQMPIEEKKKFADVIIDNSGTMADTERQVDVLWETWVRDNGFVR